MSNKTAEIANRVAHAWLNTSVEDMRSSMDCQRRNGNLNIRALRRLYFMASMRGQKTRTAVAARFLKKWLQARKEAP